MFKKEYVFAALIASVVILLSNIFLINPLLAPKDGMTFLGRRVINSQDTYTYVAFVEQARQGRWLFENLYTPEPQKANLLRPSYLFLGKIAAVFSIPSIVIYNAGRVFFSIIFCFVLYMFLRLFFKTPKTRLLAYAVILTSSGLGFLLGGIFPTSSDLWIPEANTFLSLGEAPHFILSQTLMLISFMFILKTWRGPLPGKKRYNAWYLLISFLALILLGFEHPFNLAVVTLSVIMTGVYLFIKNKEVLEKDIFYAVGISIIASVLAAAFQVFSLLQNPALKNWAQQNILATPNPILFIVGYGLILIFASIGLETYLKEKKTPQILIVSWIASTCVLLYMPIFFQRRFSEGLHIPFAILATVGIITSGYFLSRFTIHAVQKTALYTYCIAAVVILMAGSIASIGNDIVTISHDTQSAYYYYLLDSEVLSMEWLSQHTTPNDIILTNWFYGNILPGIAGRKVFVGHKVQTPYFDQKVEEINQFLGSKSADKAYQFLAKNKITYVFFGKNDSMLEQGYDPDKKAYLVKIYDQDNVRIYRVR